MNNIYDLSQIRELEGQRKRLIFNFVISVLCALGVIAAACLLIENALILTLVFSLVMLSLGVWSVLFWRIRYAILREHIAFLENMEMGNKSDFVGIFVGVEKSEDADGYFDRYVFRAAGREETFLVHSGCPVDLVSGEKYHTEQVGSYIFRWEKYENR